VLIDCEGWIADDKSVTNMDEAKVFQRVKGWLIVVGDGDILPAVEMGIRFMETGQTALIWAHSKYAMGPGTRTCEGVSVPPYSNVMFKVTVSMKVIDTSRLNPYFTIQKALTKKKIANDIYQCEWCPPPTSKDDPTCEQAMNRAIRLYTKTAKEMETLLEGNYFAQVEQDHPQRLESQKLLLDVLNNIVAVHLKQKEYHKAKLASVDVLQVDPHNLKALLRAAKAALLDPASTLEEASAALAAAESDITYKNPEEEKQLQRLKVLLKKKKQEYKETSKSMFGNKLASSSSSSKTTKENKTEKAESPKADDPTTTSNSSDEKVTTDSTGKGKSSSTTTSVGEEENEKEAESSEKEKKEEEDPNKFWKNQLYVVFIQVVVPLLMFLLFRYANPSGKFETKAAGEEEEEE
jgi:hypothetical protein